ncbi:MAG: hypothetical protein ACI841_003251 [Planctomycetota bacterium]|jgi:hypothetical protein
MRYLPHKSHQARTQLRRAIVSAVFMHTLKTEHSMLLINMRPDNPVAAVYFGVNSTLITRAKQLLRARRNRASGQAWTTGRVLTTYQHHLKLDPQPTRPRKALNHNSLRNLDRGCPHFGPAPKITKNLSLRFFGENQSSPLTASNTFLCRSLPS